MIVCAMDSIPVKPDSEGVSEREQENKHDIERKHG